MHVLVCVIKLVSHHLRNMSLVFSFFSTSRKRSYASETWNRVLIRSYHVYKGADISVST